MLNSISTNAMACQLFMRSFCTAVYVIFESNLFLNLKTEHSQHSLHHHHHPATNNNITTNNRLNNINNNYKNHDSNHNDVLFF